MQGLPPEEQAAILVTWYKQGPNYMKRYLENRADKPASEWGTIAPGEGTGLLKFWKGINEALDGTYEYPYFQNFCSLGNFPIDDEINTPQNGSDHLTRRINARMGAITKTSPPQ